MSEVPSQDFQAEASTPFQKVENIESLTDQIKSQVNESALNLLRRSFTFKNILEYSGVNEAFLESVFKDLGLESEDVDKAASENTNHLRSEEVHNKSDGDAIVSIKKHSRKTQSQNKPFLEDRAKQSSRKNIEFEMRLFLLRVKMEINKVSSIMEDNYVQEQLEDEELRHNILCKKDFLINEIERLFENIKENPEKSVLLQKRRLSNEVKDDRLDPKHSKETACMEKSHIKDSSPEYANDGSPSSPTQVCIEMFQRRSRILVLTHSLNPILHIPLPTCGCWCDRWNITAI